MIQTLIGNRGLLALCGILDAVVAAIYLLMQDTSGPVTFHSWNGPIALMGKLIIAAGVCTIAAGLWKSATGRVWLLVVNGSALFVLGLIHYAFARYRVSFLTVAVLIVLMAISLGMLELAIARIFRLSHRTGEACVVGICGIVAFGFVVPFLLLGLRWIAVKPGSHPDLLWLAFFFMFSTLSMFGLATRLGTN
ncbi:MAG: hypothetical protein U0Q18_17820 [Bryobacteraceae bacterium]